MFDKRISELIPGGTYTPPIEPRGFIIHYELRSFNRRQRRGPRGRVITLIRKKKEAGVFVNRGAYPEHSLISKMPFPFSNSPSFSFCSNESLFSLQPNATPGKHCQWVLFRYTTSIEKQVSNTVKGQPMGRLYTCQNGVVPKK
jgi:hypothetical protein